MLRAFVLVACLAAAASAQAHCFLREYEWTPAEEGSAGWYVDVDVLAPRPLLLELQDVAVGAPESNQCAHGAHADYIVFAWDRLPFAQFPVPCGRHDTLYFGISNLGAARWGESAHKPVDGTLFAPQLGRSDMASGTASAAAEPVRFRRLRMWSMSGATRAPAAPLTLHACVDAAPTDVDPAARTVTPPRLLPLFDCVHAFGGHCGTNLGWINSELDEIALEPHTDANRVAPAYIENGWHLPASYAPGRHAPASLQPRLHVGWPCDPGTAAGVEARWHLDGRTLHLDALTRRCEVEVAAPGHVLVWGETPAERDGARTKAAQAAADHDALDLGGGQAEQVERPHVAQVAHEAAVEGWRKAGVEFPYMSRIAAEQRAKANAAAKHHTVARDCDDSTSCCGDDCDAWWISLIVLGAVFLIGLFVLFALLWWCEPDGWYWWPHPHAPHAMHPYESRAEYERLHGRAPPAE
jgi:hypothetical protein